MALPVDSSTLLSTNERDFVIDAVHSRLRCDGRRMMELRKVTIALHRNATSSRAEVCLGDTKVAAVVSATLVPPFPDRPTEGFFRVGYDLSPMASPGFEGGRPSPEAAQMSRALERLLRDSRAVDMEALCVQAGKRVWEVRVDVRALDHRGNLFDAGSLAALAAVRHFRRPRVDISPEGGVRICPLDEQEGEPLSVHHSPVSLSFGVLDYAVGPGGPLRTPAGTSASVATAAGVGAREQRVLLDLTDREEAVAASVLALSVTAHGELCAVHKLGGAPVATATVTHCARVAATVAEALCEQLDGALDAADAADRELRYARPSTAAHARALGGSTHAAPGTFTAFLPDAVPVDAADASLDEAGGDSAAVSAGAAGVNGARRRATETARAAGADAAAGGIVSARRGAAAAATGEAGAGAPAASRVEEAGRARAEGEGEVGGKEEEEEGEGEGEGGAARPTRILVRADAGPEPDAAGGLAAGLTGVGTAKGKKRRRKGRKS